MLNRSQLPVSDGPGCKWRIESRYDGRCTQKLLDRQQGALRAGCGIAQNGAVDPDSVQRRPNLASSPAALQTRSGPIPRRH